MDAALTQAVAFDRRATRVIQRMEFGRLFELALLIPGTICGIPEACSSVMTSFSIVK